MKPSRQVLTYSRSLLKKMPATIHLKDLTLLDWALLKLIIYYIQNVLSPTLIASQFRDALGFRRLKLDCPGNRFGKCKKWRKVHINCLCSKGFDDITKQLGEDLMVFTTKQLEEKRYMLESILRFRYQSFVKIISQHYDKSVEHEESDTHYNPCIDCYKNNMFMRYYQKKLELEFIEGHYFERYLDEVDDKKSLNQQILKLAFVDWSIISQMERSKRYLEQNEDRRKKLKAERDEREEQKKILLNPH